MAEVPRKSVKVVDMFEIPSGQPERLGKYDVIVTYQDEAMRTRTVTIPREELEGKSDTERLAVISNAIKAKEAERGAVVGKTITI
jgi:hypothetical protein